MTYKRNKQELALELRILRKQLRSARSHISLLEKLLESSKKENMTITVIKRVEPTEVTYYITCKSCASELGYNKTDVKVYAEDRPCGVYQEYIDCPVCNKKIVLKQL